MRVYHVPNEYSSSVTPRLLHVCNPYIPVLDQYTGDLSSSMIRATGHQLVALCRSVVEEEKNQLLVPLMTRQYSGTVPYNSVIPWFHRLLFCLQSLMMCWTNSTRGLPQHVLPLLRQRTQVKKRLTQASLDGGYAQNVPSKWRRAMPWVSWLSFLCLVPLTLPQNWVSFTASFAEKTSQSSPMAVQSSCATFKGSEIFRGISGSGLRLLGGVSLGSMASLWQKMSWRGNVRKFCRLPRCSGQRIPVPRRFDSGCFRKHWPSPSRARQGFVPRQCIQAGRKLRVGWTSVGAVRLEGQSSQCQRYLVAQGSFGTSVCPPERMCRLLVTCLLIHLF